MSGPADREDSVRRNTAFALLAQVATAAFTAGLTFFLVRRLGPHDYGLFALALGVAALVALPADFGISQSAARFVAERLGDREAMAAVLAGAGRIKLATAGALGLALALLAEPVAAAYGEPGLTWPLRGVAVAVAGQSVMGLYLAAFVAIRRVAVNARLIVSESAVEAGASVALVLLGGGASGAAFGRAVGYAAGAAFSILLAARIFGRRVMALRSPGTSIRALARYGGALLIVDSAYSLFSAFDVLVIGAFLGSAGVGLYSAPMRLCTVLHYPGLALSNSVSPRVARRRGRAIESDAFIAGLRGLIVLQAAMVAPIVVWAGPITRLALGDSYGASAGVLRALAPFVFLQGLGPLLSVSVNFLGQARRRIPIALASLAVNLGVAILLVPLIGVIGGAISTSLAYAIYVPAHFRLCLGMLGLSAAPFLRTLTRSLLAAAGMAAVLAVAGTSAISPLEALVTLPLGLAVFVAVLLATGEIRLSTVRSGTRKLARALRPHRTPAGD
jgi:O-antigen/teichoic acid export membrane protein